MNLISIFLLLLSPSLVYGRSNSLPARNDVKRWTIPWVEPNILNHDFFVAVKVNDIDFDVIPVDTGSTGFLIVATLLNYNHESELIDLGLEPAFEYLSSSMLYYKGYWLPSNLTFTSVDGTAIRSTIPVFAVVETGKCTQYPQGQTCPNATADRKVIPDSRMHTRYMGVGFGRWSNEQPQATVDKNSLLNINFEGDETLRSGYIISDIGVVVGVRSEDLKDGWNTTQLTKNADAPQGSRPEWNGTPMCVEVAGSLCSNSTGTVLFDTGINYSVVGVAPDVTEHLKHCAPITPTLTRCYLNDHVEVKIRIGVPGHYVAEHSFKVGENSTPMVTPAKAQVGKMHGNQTFVNTGRYFYNKFNLIFDYMSGTVGLKDRTVSGMSPEAMRADDAVFSKFDEL